MLQNVISQQEIGRRIMLLRKQKQFSQAEIAALLMMSRSSWVQAEAGKRALSVMELVKLSKIMQFSIDDFVNNDFDITRLPTETTAETSYLRISEPNLNVPKMQNTLLYIFERCAGKPNINDNSLHLLLYFIDFNYYEHYECQLTGAEYRKINNAPVFIKLDAILQKMITEKQITTLKVTHNNTIQRQRRFIPLQKPDLNPLKASETAAVDLVLEQLSNLSDSALLQYAQNDMPLKATAENQCIDYELAFYREPPYSLT